MNYPHNRPEIPSGNPIANALVVVAGVVMIGLSLILGVVAFIAIGSIALVLAAIIGIRVWWFQRQLRKVAAKTGRPRDARDDAIEIIEGEYRVVTRDSDDS